MVNGGKDRPIIGPPDKVIGKKSYKIAHSQQWRGFAGVADNCILQVRTPFPSPRMPGKQSRMVKHNSAAVQGQPSHAAHLDQGAHNGQPAATIAQAWPPHGRPLFHVPSLLAPCLLASCVQIQAAFQASFGLTPVISDNLLLIINKLAK